MAKKKTSVKKMVKSKSSIDDAQPRRLSATEVTQELTKLPGWELYDGKIVRVYTFKNFYETIGFVNAVAWIANSVNHHPDLEVGYAKCVVKFSTHDVAGLSKGDFDVAARIDALPKLP